MARTGSYVECELIFRAAGLSLAEFSVSQKLTAETKDRDTHWRPIRLCDL